MGQEEAVPVTGRTRWRRFLLVMAPAYAALAGVVYLVLTGSLAVTFAISGTPFTVTADTVQSTGVDGNGMAFYQFGEINFQGDGTAVPQLESLVPNAQLTNLCQSVTVFPLTLRITAGTAADRPVTATNLVTDVSSQTADSATFTNINIGQDLHEFTNPQIRFPVSRGDENGGSGGPNVTVQQVPQGWFGQTATGVTITKLRQTANASSAGSFTLPNLSVSFGDAC
ncbi:MAG TPA: DUF6230 family protein [Candidatus Dormibacteraeota bacterium]|nr:DUF6230 family protein [Candidatus Dormibacteraeota bacterium]